MAFGRRTGGDGREKPRSRNLTVKREHKYLAIHARSSPKVYAHVRSRSRQQRSGKELTKTRGREVWEEIPFGVTVRSQAHETLGAMTTVIMRTSDDNRGQLFLALFQGFPFLGNLPITLVFHEAPTGTQE